MVFYSSATTSGKFTLDPLLRRSLNCFHALTRRFNVFYSCPILHLINLSGNHNVPPCLSFKSPSYKNPLWDLVALHGLTGKALSGRRLMCTVLFLQLACMSCHLTCASVTSQVALKTEISTENFSLQITSQLSCSRYAHTGERQKGAQSQCKIAKRLRSENEEKARSVNLT